jgi:hypothetical protein
MQQDVNIELPLIENVLLPHSDRGKINTAKNITNYAQKCAKKTMVLAHKEAEDIRASAAVAGYEHGIILALDAVIQFFDDRDSLIKLIYKQTEMEIKGLLGDIINQQSVVLTLIKDWLSTLSHDLVSEPVCLLLPEHCRH